MTATDNYKYALLNNAIRHPIRFIIPNRKWQDKSDKGSHQNTSSYLAKLDAPKVGSPLRKEIKYRVPTNTKPRAIAKTEAADTGGPSNSPVVVHKNNYLGTSQEQTVKTPKKESKDLKKAVKSFWDKAYKLA